MILQIQKKCVAGGTALSAYTPNQWPVLITQGPLLHKCLHIDEVANEYHCRSPKALNSFRVRKHWLSQVGLAIVIVFQCGSGRDVSPGAEEASAPLNNLRAVEVLPEKEDPWCSLHGQRQLPCIRIIYNGLHHPVNKKRHLREKAIAVEIVCWPQKRATDSVE